MELFGHYRGETLDLSTWRSMYPHPAVVLQVTQDGRCVDHQLVYVRRERFLLRRAEIDARHEIIDAARWQRVETGAAQSGRAAAVESKTHFTRGVADDDPRLVTKPAVEWKAGARRCQGPSGGRNVHLG